MARHLTTRSVSRLLSESGPLRRFTRDSAELRDGSWQESMLCAREERLVDSLARRLRRLVQSEGMDPLRALSHCQDHALKTAVAQIERIAHERFTLALEAVEDAPAREVLTRLRDLYVLSVMERDRAWWLEHGFFDGDTGKAVQREVNVLCGQLRPAALGLVASFGIPDALLRAPIAVEPQASGAGTD
jgi:acyl-CoA oxidase